MKQIDEVEIRQKAELYALKRFKDGEVMDELSAFEAGVHWAQQRLLQQTHVSLSLPPTDKIKEALLLGYVVGRCSTADIEENVLWENYQKHILKLNKVPNDDCGNAS